MKRLEVGTEVVCKTTGVDGYVIAQVLTRKYGRNYIENSTIEYEVHWHHSNKVTLEPRSNLIPQYPTIKPP